MTKEQAIVELKELINLFQYNIEQYKTKAYDEAKARADFIDKFFDLLGWDIYNKQGFSEKYRDVVREDRVTIKGKVKAPDYCFRIGGARKFFVEAKKPSIDIKHDIVPAFQLRRYAYTAKLPLSILTDFEEFSIYDTRIKPNKTDKASTARIFYCEYQQYIDEFDFIFDTFSKNAIQKGSFDKYIEDPRRKKGTSEVDKEFLKLIEIWRENLAKNIALRNKNLNIYELNYVVQIIIDRVIFLRIAEDRQMEDYGRIRKLTEDKKTIYPELVKLFLQADVKYNSGLFDFKKDQLTPHLKIDDKILKDIIAHLYYPDSPYEFSVLDVEILGNIYEQFLGKTIRLTPAHQAKVEDKPEVKKAGGVYYTPKYIVDYIVEHTVREKIKDKTPGEILNIKILDPACGSGSFLLGAYQLLMDYHLNYYTGGLTRKSDKISKQQQSILKKALKENKIYQLREDEYQLTIEEKHNILLNNIFGVDIDRQAVEVTKLSLLLKLLEGESMESSGLLFKYSDIKLLPDLSDNIKCGNSLIGSDFYEKGQMSLFQDEETVRRINVFDWEKEFPEIFQKGGFDVVIGNPPYLRIQGLQEYYGDQINYFIENYKSAVKRFDLYMIFIEKSFRILKQDGRSGFICPHKFINSDFGSGLREFLISNSAIGFIVSFGHNLIFEKATTYTGILTLSKTQHDSFKYYEFKNMPEKDLSNTLTELGNNEFSIFKFSIFTKDPWVLTTTNKSKLLSRIVQPNNLGDVFSEILVGIQSGIDRIHVLKFISNISDNIIKLYSESENTEIEIEKGLVKPFLRGEDIKRYENPKHSYYCIYPYKLINGNTKILNEEELKIIFPLGYNYLHKYRKELTEIRKRQKTNPKYWYSCHRPRSMNLFETTRIITPEISLGCNMTLSEAGIYHNTKVYSLIPHTSRKENIKYWLGLLNSKILWWFLSNTGYVLRGGYFTFKTNYLKPFPIKTIDFNNKIDKKQHDKMVELVDMMLELQKKIHSAKIETEKTLFKKQIEIVDKQIDQLVYELYGLTDEEIKIVEEDIGNSKK